LPKKSALGGTKLLAGLELFSRYHVVVG
jgi:hypothetical protein